MSLNKVISAYEYYSKSRFLQQLMDEISEIKSIEAESKQSKDTLLSEISRVDKKILAYESEKKESKKTLDSFEKEIGSYEQNRKEGNSKLQKLVQMIEFSNTTLVTYESTLKEKKAQWEDVKRNLQGAANNKSVDNLDDATETITRQLEQAEKKFQDNQNYIVRLRQKMRQIEEQLEMEKSMVDSSLNNRYWF